MISIITDPIVIKKLQQQFEEQLKKYCKLIIQTKLGHLGKSDATHVFYSETYDFWVCLDKFENRYFNAFGLGKPVTHGNVPMVVEINPPLEGVNRNMGGAFGVDENNQVFLLHRGRIGGGKTGVGKKLFSEKYSESPIRVWDKDKWNDLFVVTILGSDRTVEDIFNFVKETHEIKETFRKNEIMPNEDLSYPKNTSSFLDSDERTEDRKAPVYSNEAIKLRHGYVFRVLKEILKDEGMNALRDKNKDLLIIDQLGTSKVLFEIKTTSSIPNIYTSLGQLLFYSMSVVPKPRLIMVMPKKLDSLLEEHLKVYGIELLYYKWENNETTPIFDKKDIQSFLEYRL